MKNLKSKLRLSLCLLIVCFSTFAQTDSHDCEIVVTRADLEKCATYKRQNEFLEKEVKLQAVGAVSLRDTIKARDNSLIEIKKSLNDESESKLWWRNFTIILAVIIVLLLCLIIFGHKLAKFIVVFCLFSAQSFAQAPDYRPPFSLNSQKGLNQKIVYDTTSNKFSIESANDVHIFKIPYGKLYINPGNQFQYYRGDKTWQTLNKLAVGLGNVDNTSDLSKPISTLTQAALNAKEDTVSSGTTSQYYRGDKTWQTLDKSAVGLGNVDNTSDLSKPISTLTQAALNAKENTVLSGTTSQYYRGDKTWQTLDKTAIGLSNVDNTAISTWAGSTNITTIGAATASTLKVGASTPYFTLNNYFSVPRISSSTAFDFFSTGTFSWTTTGDLQQMKLTTTGLKLGSGSATYKLDLTGDFGYQGLIYVGNTARGIAMSSGSNGQFLKKNTVTDGYGASLAVNQWANIGVSDVTGLGSLASLNSVSLISNVTGLLPDANISSASVWNAKQNALTNPVTGAGTIGYLAKYTGSTSHGNSVIFESGGNIGIGTNAPLFQTEISGVGEPIIGGINNTGAKGGYILLKDNSNTAYSGGAVVFATGFGVLGAIKGEVRDGGSYSKGDLSIQVRTNITDTKLTTAIQIKSNGNIGIGTIEPASTALLDLSSTSKCLKLTVVTTTERNAIALPQAGYILFNSSTGKFEGYDGTSWVALH